MGKHHRRDGVYKQCACPTGVECVKKHGTWSYDVRVGTNPVTGKPTRRNENGFGTRKEAVEAKARVVAELSSGPNPYDRLLTVGEWLDIWLRDLDGREASTVRGYETNVRLIWKPLIGKIRLRDLTHKHVNDALSAAAVRSPDERPASGNARSEFARHGKWVEQRSMATLQLYRATLRRALTVAVTRQLVSVNVAAGEMDALREPKTAKSARIAGTKRVIWTPDQTKQFFAFIEDHEWALLYNCYAYTGARRAEWLGMRWATMNASGTHIQVLSTAVAGSGQMPCFICPAGHKGIELKNRPKSEASIRWIPLSTGLADALRVHRAKQRFRVVSDTFFVDHDLVFPDEDGGPLTPKKVTDTFNELVAEAGVPQLSGLHALRHIVVSTMLGLGIPPETVAQVTGHDVATLRRFYAHYMEEYAAAAAQRYSDAVDSSPTPVAALSAWLK
jgi:integrase